MEMLAHNNLAILSVSILTALIYTALIYLTLPAKSVRVRSLVTYWALGTFSVLLIYVLHDVFPQWDSAMFKDSLSQVTIYSFIAWHLIQVAAKEEISKYLAFKLINRARNKYVKADLPIGTMIYYGMVGAGFASIEMLTNTVDLAQSAAYNSPYSVHKPLAAIMLSRHATGTIMHMGLGMIMGYFVSISRLKPVWKGSLLYEWSNRFRTAYKWSCLMIGLISVTAIHGMFNMNQQVGNFYTDPSTHLIIYFVVTVSFFGGRHLISLQAKNGQ